MTDLDQKDLLYRLHNLMKEYKVLSDEVAKLQKSRDKLQKKVEELENILAQIPPEFLPKNYNTKIGSDKQLRFDMVTVLYIDIHGFKNGLL